MARFLPTMQFLRTGVSSLVINRIAQSPIYNCQHHLPTNIWAVDGLHVFQYRMQTQQASSISEALKLRNTNSGICWKCLTALNKRSKFFCGNCGTVLPLNEKSDHFKLFDVKKEFQIPLSQIQAKFKSLQKDLHPDKFSMKDSLEVAISESVSSHLNKAYFTLQKPLSRGLYLLELEGIEIGESIETDDPAFLMEILELNEEMEDIASTEELRFMESKLKLKIHELTDAIADAFRSKAIQTAKLLLIKYKYFENVQAKLKERLPPE